MQTITSFLQNQHQQFHAYSSLRVNLYLNSHDKNEATILLAANKVNQLITKLVAKKYVSGAIWAIAFDDNKGVYIQTIFYLDDSQHDALAMMAIESLWSHLTQNVGLLIELDVEPNVMDVLTSELSTHLLQGHIKENVHYGSIGGV
ncbi:hypothetical protein [Orbus mooreae]|uniref:hypothetical protein n=1 Tax=Orbus mooreae TaxID=3074107 RepID=UPI00370D4AF7